MSDAPATEHTRPAGPPTRIDRGLAPSIDPAPSSPIAVAARRFGDQYPLRVDNTAVRITATLLVASLLVYVPWLVLHLNHAVPWVTWPFLAAHVLTIASLLLTVANTWSRTVPPPRPLPVGTEPHVAVIIPTCGEAPSMVVRTVVSVIEQDWPLDRLTIVVSDDGHDPALRSALGDLPVRYHEPPDRFAPGRDGAAKAGNLNSAVALLDTEMPGLQYVETRDADDEVASASFLRLVLGQLEADEQLAYVQTIKEAQVSAGDPFNNRESMFYRNLMLAKNHANAVFPCGSGVVWRRDALRDIGEFPTWNLVEDLQSGLEALRRGWNGMYLPIVGAVGQHAPEDVPNVFKQRGTWAVDTVRLMVWGDHSGLSLRQRSHFAMTLLYYLTSFSTLTYIACVICSLLGASPVHDDSIRALWFILPFALANELFLVASNHPFNDRRTRQRRRVRDAWRVRVLWTGMAPIYAMATCIAIAGGRRRKPVYRVTRKQHDTRWHWRQTMPHIAILALGAASVAYSIANDTLQGPGEIAATVYFGCLYFALLASFVTRGWHGIELDRLPTIERRRRAPG